MVQTNNLAFLSWRDFSSSLLLLKLNFHWIFRVCWQGNTYLTFPNITLIILQDLENTEKENSVLKQNILSSNLFSAGFLICNNHQEYLHQAE